ncbi:hypothetical protein GCM10020331_001760 [Ectobacillus funiculus]
MERALADVRVARAVSISVIAKVNCTPIVRQKSNYRGVSSCQYTNYIEECKLDVLNFIIETGTSLVEIAVAFNIPAPSTILRWKKLLEIQGIQALQSKKCN